MRFVRAHMSFATLLAHTLWVFLLAGDTSFIISRRTQAYECLKNPSSFLCKDVAQFDGDSPNNTDRVLQLTVEVDGEW